MSNVESGTAVPLQLLDSCADSEGGTGDQRYKKHLCSPDPKKIGCPFYFYFVKKLAKKKGCCNFTYFMLRFYDAVFHS